MLGILETPPDLSRGARSGGCDMRYCASCQQPYDDQWDGCPKCVHKRDWVLARVDSRLTLIAVIMALAALGSIVASCSALLS